MSQILPAAVAAGVRETIQESMYEVEDSQKGWSPYGTNTIPQMVMDIVRTNFASKVAEELFGFPAIAHSHDMLDVHPRASHAVAT